MCVDPMTSSAAEQKRNVGRAAGTTPPPAKKPLQVVNSAPSAAEMKRGVCGSRLLRIARDKLGSGLGTMGRRTVEFLIFRMSHGPVTVHTERSAWLLLHLSRFRSHTQLLLDCGAVDTLVDLILKLPVPWDLSIPRTSSCGSCHSNSGVALSSPGRGLAAEGGDNDDERCVEANTVEHATGALALLAQQDYDCRARIAHLGAVEALVALLGEGPDCMATENAVQILHCLAASTPALRDEIREAEAIPALVELLHDAPGANNLFLTRTILWTLICLAEQSPFNQTAIWNAGGCQALIPLLSDGYFLNSAVRDASGIQALAARCLYVLSLDSSETQFAVFRLGVVTHLVALLERSIYTLSYTARELDTLWQKNVAVLVAQWVLLYQVHAQVAERAREAVAQTASHSDPGTQQRLEEEVGELQENVWCAWREVAAELVLRLLPVSSQKLNPAREGLRCLKALIASSEIGAQFAMEAESIPILVEACRLQVEANRDRTTFVSEPAEILSLVVAHNPEAQEAVRKLGGVELLVQMLPSASGNGTSRDVDDASQDEILRFWWDRIMWSEDRGQEAMGSQAEYPFHLCKVTAAALDSVVHGNPVNCETARKAGVVQPLVQILHNAVCCKRHSVVLSTTSALGSLLDGNHEMQKEVLCCRGIAPLMSLLRVPSDSNIWSFHDWLFLQTQAARCTRHLVEDFPTGQRRMKQGGALPFLLHLVEEVVTRGTTQRLGFPGPRGMSQEDIEDEAVAAGLWAINNLVAHDQDNQESFRRAMGVPLLVQVLQSRGDSQAVTGAVWTVAQLAAGGDECQAELESAGVIPALLGLAKKHSVADDPLCEGLARAVANLANGSPNNQDALRTSGAVELMVAMLQCGEDAVTSECAAQALSTLCWQHPANQTLVGEIGGLQLLVKYLQAGPHSLLARGSSIALAAAMGSNFRNQSAVRDAGGTFMLVDMLRCGPGNPIIIPTLHTIRLLVQGHRAAQSEVCEAGGPAALLRLLQSAVSEEVIREAASALSALTQDHPSNKATVQREGGVAVLLSVLQRGNEALSSRAVALPGAWEEHGPALPLQPSEDEASPSSLQIKLGSVEQAALALANIAGSSTAAKAEVRELEGIQLIIQLLGLAITAQEHWPEGGTWLSGVCSSTAKVLAAVSGSCMANQATVRNHGGLEVLVRGLKMGQDEESAVEETAFILRCLISKQERFWDSAMMSIGSRNDPKSIRMKTCVWKFFESEGTSILQHWALDAMLADGLDKPSRSQFVWALQQLASESPENREELAELYQSGIVPLMVRLDEMSMVLRPALTNRMRSLIHRYLPR